jgi:hypothetical protein
MHWPARPDWFAIKAHRRQILTLGLKWWNVERALSLGALIDL